MKAASGRQLVRARSAVRLRSGPPASAWSNRKRARRLWPSGSSGHLQAGAWFTTTSRPDPCVAVTPASPGLGEAAARRAILPRGAIRLAPRLRGGLLRMDDALLAAGDTV